jgi:hypothetical protein
MKLPGFTAEQSLRQVISHGLSKNLFSPNSKEEVVPQGFISYCPGLTQPWGIDFTMDNLGPVLCYTPWDGDYIIPRIEYIHKEPLLQYLP